MAWIVEVLVTLAGVAYVVLAARRNRLCWLAGAVAAALLGWLSFERKLPMQAALQGYYIGMAVYGWWNWTRASQARDLPVGTLGLRWHLLAALLLVPLSWITAEWLARETQAAWPMLDSLATWFGLFATWLTARARIENWIYWIVIDGVLVFLYYKQGAPIVALQFAAFTALAAGGFVAWRRKLMQQVPP